jgi:adenylate kinase family enzyme
MKIIILGQPRSGKSTLANILSKELNLPIICTDKYRREWNYHEPWKNFDTEINPKKQQEFYKQLNELYNSYEDVILEGSSINPIDRKLFTYDAIVLLGRNISAEDMLKYTRRYDHDWTTKRNDEYLLELFKNYLHYSKLWVDKNKEIYVDTTNFDAGIEKAKKSILEQLKGDDTKCI